MNACCSDPETICLQCGDKGFTNAFVYCVKCLKFAVHRYCLDVIPKSFNEFVRWVCDDCEMEGLTEPAISKNNAIQSKTRRYHTPSKHILGTSVVATKKNVTLALEIEESINEDDPCRSIDACAKPDSVEYADSADERKGIGKQKINNNLICDDNLSTDVPPRESMKINRGAIAVSDRSHEKCANVGISECAKLASDSTPSIEVKEKKVSEKRDIRNFSQKLSESEPEAGTVLHRILSCNGSLESYKKKKTSMSSEANLEEPRQRVSKDDYESRESEASEDRTSASHHKSNSHKGLSKDSTISSMVDCNVRAEPLKKPIWSGSFNIWNKKDDILEGLMAHMSSRACQKVHNEACQFQSILHLEMLPKSDVWPKRFKASGASAESIALYFFPSDIRSERVFDYLVDEMVNKELAMRSIVPNAELLVFASTELPLPYWRFQGKYYLWGVFREKQHQVSRSQKWRKEARYNPIMRKDHIDDNDASEGSSERVTCVKLFEYICWTSKRRCREYEIGMGLKYRLSIIIASICLDFLFSLVF